MPGILSAITGQSVLPLQISEAVFPATDVTVLIIIILVLLLFTAITAGAEAAYFSLSVKDINYLKTREQLSARQAVQLLEQPRVLLGTIIVANNFINIAVIITSSLLIRQLLEHSYGLPAAVLIKNHALVYYSVQIIAIGFMLVLFGAVLPRVYALQNNVRMVLFAAPVLIALSWLFRPVSRMLVSSSSYIEDKIGGRDNPITGAYFEQVIEQSVGHPATQEEVNIFKGILKFGNITVRQIMRTRLDIIAVRYDHSFPEVQLIAINAGYARIPVYEKSLDTIKGVVNSKDFLPYSDNPSFDWHTLIRPAYFVHENKLIEDLLREFQKKRTHLAIVVDEFGGTSGIVTLEDIIEEIIGDIRDESREEDLQFTKTDDYNFIFEGKILINDVCRIIGRSPEVFESVRGGSDSLAGLLLEISGRFPAVNETISYREYDFTVLEIDRMRIKMVKLTIDQDYTDPE